MNTDIRLSISWLSHPKRRKLEKRLGPKGALSFLDLLLEVAQNKPNGCLNGWSNEDIALAAQWPESADIFVGTLVELRLLDHDQTHGFYQVHDWEQHNPYASRSELRSERGRKGAAARWEKKHKQAMLNDATSNALSINKHCSKHSTAMLGAQTSNAPAPAPLAIKQQHPPYPPSCLASAASTTSLLSLSPSDGIFVGENESPPTIQAQQLSSIREEVSPNGNGGPPLYVSELIAMVPSQHRKPSVESIIAKFLKTHDPELIRRNIKYANEHATTNYAGYLAMAIREDYASGADARASPAETVQKSIEEQWLKFESMLEETQLQDKEFESARQEWLSLPPPIREEWLENAGRANPFLAANSSAGLELLAVELFRQERVRSPTA